jgi:recombination protein RecA
MPRGKDEPKSNEPGSKTLSGASNALNAARAYLTKKKGKDFTDIRVSLDADSLKYSLPHIPSGSDVVDYLIGGQLNTFGVAPCPGFPRGRVTQIWGHESAGKTTLALEACAAVCAAGGTVLYIDWENDIVPDYAAALGVPITDSSKFELLQPETLESGIQFAMAYAAAGVDLIVFDSVGAAIPRRLAERDALETAEQGKVGELQAVWSQELPNLKRVIAKTGTAVIGISQLRAIIGAQANAAQTKPQGGNAWKYFASVRLELRRVTNEKANEFNDLTSKLEERIVGGIIKVTAVKCKMSRSQGREEIFYIRWGEGIDNIRTIIEIAAAHGIIRVKGSWQEWPDGPSGPKKWQGKEKMRTFFIENQADYNVLRERVLPLLGQGAADKFVDEDDEDATPGMIEAEGQDDKDDEIEKILSGGVKPEATTSSSPADVD